ncbi:MAG: HTTM domain-containing protein [Bdellovibrionaceae bacterium]|nr:HTTM domain-containing protein [Pseudobdellovibrionaceae bacterium]
MNRVQKKERALSVLRAVFGMDWRSLVALRIGVGVAVLVDLLTRAQDLEAHYSDFGVLPRYALLDRFTNPSHLSVHLITGTWEGQAVLFLINALIAVALIFGYRTRLASVLTWFFLLSLHNRNPVVLNAGDFALRMLAFWGIFLPWGRSFSLDAVRFAREAPDVGRNELSLATAACLLQVGMIYIFTVLLKTGDEWRVDGTAVYFAMSLDQFQLPAARFLLQFPKLMHALTFATFWLEALAPLSLFLPWGTGRVRAVVVPLLWVMHALFSLHLRVGTFSVICMVALISFVPAELWNFLFERVPHLRELRPWDRLARFFHISEVPELAVKNWFVYFEKGFVPVALLFVFYWNLSTLDSRPVRVPSSLESVAYTLRLDQKWGMFAPFPIKDDGWHVLPGRLFSYAYTGTWVDVWRDGAPVDYEKPKWATDLYPTFRWRKYMRRLWMLEYKEHRLYFGKYICRNWNREHEGVDKLETFEIVYMKENTLDEGEAPPVPVKIWTHWCYKNSVN